jgi:hypothetical protein
MNRSAPLTDRSLRGILLANAATLAVAVLQGWSVLQLLWPFWLQSVIIGWYARQRILNLDAFCTEGMKINDRPVPPTPATQRATANFFALHYGLFHALYLFFLLAMTLTTDTAGYIMVTNESTGVTSPVYIGHVHPLDFVIFVVLGWGFLGAHRASHREHVASDLAHTRNLGTLMGIPYLRIVPMHLSIILAVAVGGAVLWAFMLLKVATDVAMHKIEHRMLQGAKPDAPAAVTSGGVRRPPAS